jgi:hypothetical protein
VGSHPFRFSCQRIGQGGIVGNILEAVRFLWQRSVGVQEVVGGVSLALVHKLDSDTNQPHGYQHGEPPKKPTPPNRRHACFMTPNNTLPSYVAVCTIEGTCMYGTCTINRAVTVQGM